MITRTNEKIYVCTQHTFVNIHIHRFLVGPFGVTQIGQVRMLENVYLYELAVHNYFILRNVLVIKCI